MVLMELSNQKKKSHQQHKMMDTVAVGVRNGTVSITLGIRLVYFTQEQLSNSNLGHSGGLQVTKKKTKMCLTS